MLKRLTNKVKFYKFILHILQHPFLHNLFICGIFVISARFWYKLAYMVSENSYYFYLIFEALVIISVIYLQAYYRFKEKPVPFVFVSILLFILIYLSVLSKIPVAYCESTKVLTQLQHYNLTLLKARIEIAEFRSKTPHFFTLFNTVHDTNINWYVNVFTHSKQYQNNHCIYEGEDLFGNSVDQYIARFQLNKNHQLEVWKWHKFTNISENFDIKYKPNKYFEQHYKLQQVYNRQWLYAKNGIIYRDYYDE